MINNWAQTAQEWHVCLCIACRREPTVIAHKQMVDCVQDTREPSPSRLWYRRWIWRRKVRQLSLTAVYSHQLDALLLVTGIDVLLSLVPRIDALLSCKKGKFLYSAVSKPQDCSKCFTLYSLADLFYQKPSRLLWEAFSHAAINSQRLLVHIYSPLSIARYSFMQLSKLEQCWLKKFAQGFTRQHRIRIWVLVVESPMLYPWATALLLNGY